MNNAQETIKKTVTENKIVLFMKGTPQAPMCGFSATTVQCLNQLGAKFHAVNVLENEEIRQGIKDYANWPTIPQLYIDGKFVGGCDIVRELFANGELKKLVGETH